MSSDARAPISPSPSRRSLISLDWLNFFLADTQTGVGPFLAIYLASSRHWNDQQVGIALSAAGFATVLAQTPAGAITDWTSSKRLIVGLAVLLTAAGALVLAVRPTFADVIAAQILLGVVAAFFVPAINAISLGLVGSQAFDRRVGRSQGFNSAGNVVAAVSMGVLGYEISNRSIFFAVVLFAIPALIALLTIRPDEIDYDRSRGSKVDGGERVEGLRELIQNRRLSIFCACAFLFHFANAAMLPQLGEMLARGRGRQSALFMGACVVVTQLVITSLASLVGRTSSRWGRKPLLLIGFGVLPIRAVLYTLTAHVPILIGIQVLDGIANAIWVVVSVLVVSDFTRGTGRFNLMQGAVGTAQGLGAAASTTFAGYIVLHRGYSSAFLSLGAIAITAFLLIWTALPESKPELEKAMTAAP